MVNYKKIFVIFLFVTLLISPLATFSQGACRELEVPIPGLETTCLPALPDYIVAIYRFALMIIGIICFGALLYGGFRYLTSAGKPAAIADAKDQIFSALLGLIILFCSYLILTTINPELVILGQPEGGKCTTTADCSGGLECIGGICSAYPVSPGGSWTNCSNYVASDSCTSADCKWCSRCLGNLVNSWGTDKCVDPGIDCGYGCIIGECEAESCEGLPPPASSCSSFVVSSDCTNANCKWCPTCSGHRVNKWRADKCVEPGIDCGYTCSSGKCGVPADCGVGENWNWATCRCEAIHVCLEAGSLISTPNKFKRIEDLNEGDYVIGYKDGKKVESKILEKSEHIGEFELYFYMGYWFTENHLVFTNDYKDFKAVSKLSNITKNYQGKVYNIQTETKNYFGENDLLIHNK